MKRHIIKILFCSLAIASIQSCSDALDIVQEGELQNEVVYRSTSDLQRVLDGDIYNSLTITDQISFTSLFTDETGIGPTNSSFGTGIHQFYLDITTPEASGIWVNNYRVINRVLRLLDGSKNFTPSASEVSAYNSYLAEGRALRAFAYIELLAYYSTDISNPNALGVILLDHVPNFSEQLPRVNNSEIYKVIEDDLNFAENNILSSGGRNTSRHYVSKAMIQATKARFYLYTKRYALARENAQKVVSQSGLALTVATPTPVVTPQIQFESLNWHRTLNLYVTDVPAGNAAKASPYIKMLQDYDRGEVIFALSRPTEGTWENIASLFATNSTTVSGSNYDMGRNLYNIMRVNSGDIRKWAYLDPTSRVAAGETYLTIADYKRNDALVIDKYPGKLGFILRNDVKVFRLSEMYFILAECAAMENNLTAAATNIKAVRDARNYIAPVALPVYASSKDALIDILKERRIELSFEGFRYLDLKRLGATTGQAIDRSIIDDFTKDAPTTIPIDDYRFTLPIPRTELQANQGIQQNPGYKATP